MVFKNLEFEVRWLLRRLVQERGAALALSEAANLLQLLNRLEALTLKKAA